MTVAVLALGACVSCAEVRPAASETQLGQPGVPPGRGEAGELLDAEVATVGWDELTGSPLVLLRVVEGSGVVPIWVGPNEAQAIARALHGVELPRPMTHDLAGTLIRELGGRLEAVVIHSLVGGTYFGTLELTIAGREALIQVDTRPSDGIALALRAGAAIRVARRLVDQVPQFELQLPDTADQVLRVFGLTLVAATPERRAEHGVTSERPGLLVLEVEAVARRAGIEPGDLLVGLGGHPVAEPADLLPLLGELSRSVRVGLEVVRGDQVLELELPVAPPPRGEQRERRVV